MMNTEQIAGQLRTALAAGGPLAAAILSRTGWSDADYRLYVEIAVAVVPPVVAAVWSWVAKTDRATIAQASKVPGAEIQVDEKTASAGARAAVADEALPNVTARDANPRP